MQTSNGHPARHEYLVDHRFLLQKNVYYFCYSENEMYLNLEFPLSENRLSRIHQSRSCLQYVAKYNNLCFYMNHQYTNNFFVSPIHHLTLPMPKGRGFLLPAEVIG